MPNIIIGFSKPRKFKLLSWLIRKVERTEFSHVYIKIYDVRINRWMIFEAAGLITHCSTQDIFYSKNKEIVGYVLTCSPEVEKLVLTAAVDCLNKPYGILQLFGLGLVRFCSLFNISIKNPFSDGRKTYVCAEYVGLLLKKLGYDINNLDNLTPKMIYEMFING